MGSLTDICGYTGKTLRINLSEGKIVETVYDESFLRKYLGGTAMGVRILYDEVPRDIAYDSPKNLYFVGTGPLTGTVIGGSGTISIVTKGALTGGATSCQANGVLGAYLKFSGFDNLILTGVAPEWSYLLVKDGIAQIMDASELLGLDTYEVTDRLLEIHGVKRGGASVLSIGPAGENKVRWAGSFVDHGHSASHNGTGGVLGSKRVKAIMVFRGSGKPSIYDDQRLREISSEMYEDVEYFRGTIGGVNRMWKNQNGALPVKNYSTFKWDISDEDLEGFSKSSVRERYQISRVPCWGCRLLHSTLFEVKTGPYKCIVDEPEYEQMAAWGPNVGITNVEASIMLSGLTDKLGLDNNEAGWIVGWVMEGFEKGWLTEKQVGFNVEWGDATAVEKILRLVATRDGFGDLLGEGIKRASWLLGGKAMDAAIYTVKGNTPRGHDHRTRWAEMFDTCVSGTGTIETHMSVMIPEAQGPGNPLKVSSEVARTKGLMQLEDSAVTCRFNTRLNHKRLSSAISAATGWDMKPEEAWDIGRRAVNLMKVFNLQSGLTIAHDKPSSRYGSTPMDGPSKGITIQPHWDEMLRNYYEKMGWNPETGVPLRETLERLGLNHVWDDLSQKDHTTHNY